MSLSKMHLTSDNYDVCRICLLEPDTNREVKFLDIFSSNNEGLVLSDRIKEFFGFIVSESSIVNNELKFLRSSLFFRLI